MFVVHQLWSETCNMCDRGFLVVKFNYVSTEKIREWYFAETRNSMHLAI